MIDFSNKNNIIIGSVILVISIFIGYKVISDKGDNGNLKVIVKEDNIINDYLEKEFSKVLGIFAGEVKKSAQNMVRFNNNFLLKNDYINFRNSLYTKDIEKHSILVSTNDISDDSETNKYKVKFSSIDQTNNQTGGFGVFKNVIGFRLLKATIQANHYVIHDNNNKIDFTYNNQPYTITIDNGKYTSEDKIAKNIEEKNHLVKDTKSVSVVFSEFEQKYIFVSENKHNIEFDFTKDEKGYFNHRLLGFNKGNLIITRHGGIDNNHSSGLERTFFYNYNNGIIPDDWKVGSQITTTADPSSKSFTITELTDNKIKLKCSNENDLVDLNAIDEDTTWSTPNPNTIKFHKHFIESDLSTDVSNHFLDVVVKEIPYIACKKNSKGLNIIDRIPINVAFGELVVHEVPLSEYFSQNYFYPINLNELNIEIYSDTSDVPFENQNADNFFEFEITMLKNTKLSN